MPPHPAVSVWWPVLLTRGQAQRCHWQTCCRGWWVLLGATKDRPTGSMHFMLNLPQLTGLKVALHARLIRKWTAMSLLVPTLFTPKFKLSRPFLFQFKDQFNRLLTLLNFSLPHVVHAHPSCHSCDANVLSFQGCSLNHPQYDVTG